MKIIAFEEIKNNPFFWLYFLSTGFPLAVDAEEDIDLSDFMMENYACDTAESEWLHSFLQCTDNILNENDGYIDNPTSMIIDEYTIQYHPGDTLYLHKGKIIASTGAHYDIHQLDFPHFQAITEKLDDFQKALLLLPIVFIKPSEQNSAEELIRKLLLNLPVKPEHHHKITDMILEGISPNGERW